MMLIFIALAAASLACNLPGSTNRLPPTAVLMTQEEAQQLEEKIKATLASAAPSGELTLTITQQQINAYMVSQLKGQDEPSISDPVVVLTNNQIEIYGKITQSGLSVKSKMVLQPQIDANGDPKLEVVSIDLGGLPVPDTMKNRVETMVDNALADYLAAGSNQFKVTNIAIGEGQMTVTGTSQ